MKTKIKKNELNKQQDKPLFYRRYFIILSTAGKKILSTAIKFPFVFTNFGMLFDAGEREKKETSCMKYLHSLSHLLLQLEFSDR